MGDGQDGDLFFPNQSAESHSDDAFRFLVDIGGDLIHQQDPAFPQKALSQAQSLPLAAGKHQPRLADHGVQPLGQLRYELLQGDLIQGFHALLFRSRRIGQQQIFTDRSRKEDGLLRDFGDLLAEAFCRVFGQADAVQQDAAALRRIKPHQKVEDRGFSGAALADQPEKFSLFHGKREILQNLRAVRLVGKGYRLELDLFPECADPAALFRRNGQSEQLEELIVLTELGTEVVVGVHRFLGGGEEETGVV